MQTVSTGQKNRTSLDLNSMLEGFVLSSFSIFIGIFDKNGMDRKIYLSVLKKHSVFIKEIFFRLEKKYNSIKLFFFNVYFSGLWLNIWTKYVASVHKIRKR